MCVHCIDFFFIMARLLECDHWKHFYDTKQGSARVASIQGSLIADEAGQNLN